MDQQCNLLSAPALQATFGGGKGPVFRARRLRHGGGWVSQRLHQPGLKGKGTPSGGGEEGPPGEEPVLTNLRIGSEMAGS